VSKPAEASEVKPDESAGKVKLDASKKKRKEAKRKLEEFLKKRRRLDELRKEREDELEKERKKKDEELKKLTQWSKEVSDRRTLEELRLDSGVVVFPAWYIDEVHNRIFSRWEAPSAGGRSGARVGFDISRNGAISRVVVEKGSGNPVFDSSCESAIRDASPFAPLPQLFKGDRVRVHVTFKEE
jgi:protein TonB